jgi:L-fuconolactonase
VPIIDAQLHAYVPDSPDYPWDTHWLERRGGDPGVFRTAYPAERLLSEMDAAGVDAAVLVSPSLYGDDHRYALRAAERHPHRFGVVVPVSPGTPEVEALVRSFARCAGRLGVRVIWTSDCDEIVLGTGYRRIYEAARSAGVPLFVFAVGSEAKGFLGAVERVARAYEDLQLIIDHLGIVALTDQREAPGRPIERLAALGVFPNVAVKCSSVVQLSREPYPFTDLWPHLNRVLEGFGPERVFWGSDLTVQRTCATYAESLDYIRCSNQLSAHERELVLGGALQQLLGWPTRF